MASNLMKGGKPPMLPRQKAAPTTPKGKPPVTGRALAAQKVKNPTAQAALAKPRPTPGKPMLGAQSARPVTRPAMPPAAGSRRPMLPRQTAKRGF